MKPVKGLFSEAERKFKKEARYRNKIEVTDEIWFFFDVDHDQAGSWKTNQNIMQTLPGICKGGFCRDSGDCRAHGHSGSEWSMDFADCGWYSNAGG